MLPFPGDPDLGASPGNTINCRCVQLAAKKTAETETTTTYKIFGLGEFTFAKGAA